VKINIVKGDITKVKADIVVNAANNKLEAGSGVCGAIYKAAGRNLEDWCTYFMRNRNPIEIGFVPVSPSFNMINCDKIAHTVGPIYQKGNKFMPRLLGEAYLCTLYAAHKLAAKSIAFPAISTGIYGYPILEATKVVRQALLETAYTGTVKLVCFSESDYKVYKKIIKPKRLLLSKAYGKIL